MSRFFRTNPILPNLIAILFIAAVAKTAKDSGQFYIMFPELGALALDVFRRPTGKWASEPFGLFLAPLLMAFLGTAITKYLPYHVLTILLVVAIGLVVLSVLRSSIAPAISAGVLPVVFGIQSWMYPISISGVLVVFVALLFVWKRLRKSDEPLALNDIDEVFETPPHSKRWWISFFGFLAIVGTAAQLTGLRFLLFPPLVVMAYEIFAHPGVATWTLTPKKLPFACALSAICGLVAFKFLGDGALAAAASMTASILILGLFDIHMPPAMAVGLLPLVMESPDWRYPVSVAVGTTALSVSFVIWNGFRKGKGEPKVSPELVDLREG